MTTSYRLELLVTKEGEPYYPPVGTLENVSSDNAGYDLKVVVNQVPTDTAKLVPLGVKARMVSLPDGKDSHFTLEPRSSIYKTGFMMANGRGIIDKTYRGQLMAPIITVSLIGQTSIEAGTRLFQIIAPGLGHIAEVAYVDSLPDSVRGEGGFGSTGNK